MNSLKRWFVIAVVALSIAAPAIALAVEVQQQTADSTLIAQGPIKQTKDQPQSPHPFPGDLSTANGYTWGD